MKTASESSAVPPAGDSQSFAFSGFDALPGLLTLFVAVLVGGLLLAPLGGVSALVGLVVLVLFSLGFRASVQVEPGSVCVKKMWTLIPYRVLRAREIEDVWFGGDWGEPDGAAGVVVLIEGKEVHLGSPWSMHLVHDSLWPLSARGRQIRASLELAFPPE